MIIPEEKMKAVRSFIDRLFCMETETEVIEYICPALAGIVHTDFYGFFLFPNVLRKRPLFCTNNNPEFIKAYNDTLSYYDIFTDRMINAGNSPAILHEMIRPAEYKKNSFLNEADKFRGKQGRDGCYLPLIINNTLAGFLAFGRFMDYPRYYSREELQLLMFLISFVPAGLERALSGPPPGPETAYVNGYGEIIDAGDRITLLLKEVFGERYWNRPVEHEGENGKRFKEMFERMVSGSLATGTGDVEVTVQDRAWKLSFRRLPLPDTSLREYFPRKAQVTVNIKTSGFEQGCLSLDTAFSRFSISSRERDIVNHIYRGRSNADIAAELGIAEATVKRHINNIFTKTGADSRTRLVFRLLEG